MRALRRVSAALESCAYRVVTAACDAIRVVNALTCTRAFLGPHELVLYLVSSCDDRCVFCPRFSRYAKEKKEIAPIRVDEGAFLRLVGDLKRRAVHAVRISGAGEPLFHPQIGFLVKTLLGHGLRVRVLTNGVDLRRKLGPDWYDHRHLSYRISIHAADAPTWAAIHQGHPAERFDELLRTCGRIVKRHGPHSIILYNVLCGSNFRDIARMVELGRTLGGCRVEFALVFDKGWWVEEATRVIAIPSREDLLRSIDEGVLSAERARIRTNLSSIRQIARATAQTDYEHIRGGSESIFKKTGCYIGYFFCLIGLNGDLVPCCSPGVSFGDVFSSGFPSLWNGGSYRLFRRAARRREFHRLAFCDYRKCQTVRPSLRMYRVRHPVATLRGLFKI